VARTLGRGVWGVLLWPGRGPLRPRAEEAGKEARRREKGMIHPEELKSETPQSGNSFAWADGRAGRGDGPARPCAQHGSPCLLSRPQPGRGGGEASSGGVEGILDKVRRRLLSSDWLASATAVLLESSSSLSCCSSSAD
jgi:hypothetical protein